MLAFLGDGEIVLAEFGETGLDGGNSLINFHVICLCLLHGLGDLLLDGF